MRVGCWGTFITAEGEQIRGLAYLISNITYQTKQEKTLMRKKNFLGMRAEGFQYGDYRLALSDIRHLTQVRKIDYSSELPYAQLRRILPRKSAVDGPGGGHFGFGRHLGAG
jgi:hypothetical protein